MNIFAIDHGNDSIKTRNCTFTAGLSKHFTEPSLADEWICYQGDYYALSKTPQPYMKNKSEDLNYFIYTLFGLVKEAKKGSINLNEPIILGVGLPPLHIKSLKKQFVEYFESRMKNGCEFVYCGKKYKVVLKEVIVHPQGYAAAYAYKPRRRKDGSFEVKNALLAKYDRFLIIDIGGGTIEYIYFEDNLPVLDKCETKAIGVNMMSDDIIKKISNDFGFELIRKDITAVLKGETTILPEEIKAAIKDATQAWADKIFSDAKGAVGDLRTVPCVMVGGGSRLLETYLKKSPLYPPHIEFIKSQRANVEGYDLILRDKYGVR